MTENILYDTPKPEETAPKRPTFLTVLCILTFVGSGLALISAIYGYFSVQASAAMFDTSMQGMEGMDQTGMMGELQETMRKAVENAIPNLIIGVVCALLCLFGAIQMWKQRKTGFYIYTVGELVPPIAGFILGAGGVIGSASVILGLIIAVVWVSLYAVNLKHMK
eukprot:TRINITY_DN80750_c0_g1_i1.p1 TRINITY_DN80750_c0_g1~~TRINITY_DN80750_c0_g1_i1.p1  ORF type:complete len:165 (-),score=24.08 TRINITY_DN80750_c0_g1_i1:28-522(-)